MKRGVAVNHLSNSNKSSDLARAIFMTLLVAIEDAVCADKMLAVISSNGDVARMLMGENCRTYCSEF